MALETLKEIKEIGGFKVVVMDQLKEEFPEMFNEAGAMDYARFEKEIRPNFPIQIRHDKNSISFTIQNGPIKENGINGCQVDTLMEAAHLIITKLNEKFPSEYNSRALVSLHEALHHLAARKIDRERRNVEGKSEL